MLELERFPINIDPQKTYTLIGMRSFGRGIFHRDKTHGSELGKLNFFEIISGRLIFSNIMAWEGAIGLSNEADRGCIGSNRFLSYRSTESVDLRYLNYFFQSKAGNALVRNASPGSAARNKTLSRENIERLKVPLPDFLDQRRIADKLDELLNRADTVRALRTKMTILQAGLAASLTASARETATETVRIDDVLTLARTPFDLDPAVEYRVIGMRSFGKGVIRYPSALGSEVSQMKYFTFPRDALILSNIKAWEGAIGVTSDEEANNYIASNRFLTYLPVDGRANVSYLRHYLLSREGLAKVSAASPGGADRNRTLGRKRFEALTFPLPPRPVQDQVARTLDALAEKLKSAYSEPALDALRPSILNAAFTGQL
ncbi:restriction endonuclease subunit S [Amycolatopsis sp. PS_44_ISF1]|uniref:restriction endonuclease subunit S n=1 Tax=Amycolatopsis sp. PS_44_ISF1 TaxID=2974917 RepID=UPI0028DFBBA9|nr:restriction endonuclease subunit S [Amycolatopsis sp. PS_44_ISF1]MDT8911281.1 restriction endonuclease subunit S [Amycolatopsis sp. PS_44_ISF1]